MSLRLFASCAPGLEPLLARELADLGIAEGTVVPGGVEYAGDFSTVLRSNLELGLALFVLLRFGSFRATKLPELVRKVSAIDARPYLAKGQPVAVRVRARSSRLYHTGAIEERVRAGLAQSLGAPLPEPSEGEPHASLHVRMDRDECTLSLDTSGETLHRRGYRLATAKAPLREDVARALILVSGWDRASPFVDPLMGSGTLPIEAALLASRTPPGLHRSFAFEQAPAFDARVYRKLREAALANAIAPAFPIFGSDRDAGAQRAATENAERAKMLQHLSLACAPLSTAPYREALGDAPEGALVTNPPWGFRIGEGTDLRPLYQALAKAIRALPTAWHCGLACGDRRLIQQTGLPVQSALLTDLGGTKVNLYARGAKREFSRGDAP
jgi:putative N6-adenine-specific DNA methylase